ncbi:Cog4 domain-containing protein [Mycena chlorophos]|uniref:Conserved oligomeric Golgi complex subunit 4 n=1 Tax=Mycena chlorophos TaxID=658473 RepID=A0A8H6WJS4_MYCCL|nr:Cog4 domain-containing protein [Mycena chlorophos]
MRVTDPHTCGLVTHTRAGYGPASGAGYRLAGPPHSVDSQDWEAATRHCAQAMALPSEVISGPFAETSVTSPGQKSSTARSDSPCCTPASSVGLPTTICSGVSQSRFGHHESLLQAVSEIGWEEEGLKAYATFIVDLVHRLSSPDTSQLPVTTTTPDNVFYILKVVVMRVLTPGSLNMVDRMFQQHLETDYMGVIKKKLDDMYRTNAPTGPTARGERGKRGRIVRHSLFC